MSDEPSVSAAFHATSDPSELRRSMVDLARALDNARQVDKVHWSEIKRLDEATKKLSSDFIEIIRRIDRLEVRMAIYAGIGSFVGGLLTAAIMRFIFK